MRALFLLVFFLVVKLSTAQLDTLMVNSEMLKSNVEVLIFRPFPQDQSQNIVYFTDGSKWIENGGYNELGRLSSQELIPGAIYVFVSTIDPETKKDRRNEYFFCNWVYVEFFEEELIPEVESYLGTEYSSQDRSLVGISYGGLNAAYFSSRATKFGNYGILSPLNDPCPSVAKEIEYSKTEDLKIFLSTGKNDAEKFVQPLEEVYHSKNYDVKVVRTDGGHDFRNWNAQLEEMLTFFTSLQGRN